MAKAITVEGLPELKAALATKVAELRAGAEAAVAAEVELVQGDARDSAPVKTGELRDGIEGESSGTKGTVRSKARHSEFVEFGTYKDPEQPFMKPAADRSRQRFPARAAAIIGKVVGGR